MLSGPTCTVFIDSVIPGHVQSIELGHQVFLVVSLSDSDVLFTFLTSCDGIAGSLGTNHVPRTGTTNERQDNKVCAQWLRDSKT